MDYTLKPIGFVRSTMKDHKQMPAWGAAAAVELMPEFEAGLLNLDKHSHFWILAWLMERPERDVLQVIPRGVDPDSPAPLHGVFSVRSPARPNPIGMTAAQLTARDGLILHFDRLDFLDGTPVIDLKPYFVSRDMIFSARNAAVGRPKTREALRESLLIQALRHQPVRHPDVALAVRLIEHYRVDVLKWKEPDSWTIALPPKRPYLADTLMGLTRCTFASGLSMGTPGSVWLCDSVRYELGAEGLDYDGVMRAADVELYACVPARSK